MKQTINPATTNGVVVTKTHEEVGQIISDYACDKYNVDKQNYFQCKIAILNTHQELVERPDREMYHNYISALGIGQDDNISVRMIPEGPIFDLWENENVQQSRSTIRRSGTADSLYGTLASYNYDRGVFLSLHHTDGKGIKCENVTKIHCFCLDMDDPEKVTKYWDDILELGPTFIVESSPEKYHFYWVVSDSPDVAKGEITNKELATQYRETQLQLAERFDGDRAMQSLQQPLRIPGFHHNKTDNRFLTQFKTETNQHYSYDGIRERIAKAHSEKFPAGYVQPIKKASTQNGPANSTAGNQSHSGKQYIYNGFNLKAWAVQYAKTFSIERVLKDKAPDMLVSKRSGGGFTCECPHGHEHGNNDPKGSYIVDGSEEEGFKFGCSHDTCSDRDRLDRIAKLLEDKILSVEDLLNPEYGGGPLASRAAVMQTEALLSIKIYTPSPDKTEGEFKTLSEKCWTIMPNGKFSLIEHLPEVSGGEIEYSNPNLYAALNIFGLVVMYDEFSQRRLVHGVPGTNVYSELDDRARLAIRQSFNDMGLYFSKQAFDDRVNHAADQNSVHPVREYLNSLEWDGVPRINSWLNNYAGVEDSEYTQAVGSIFLIAAVRRVRSPGCKFDTMPVFEGPQGCGKSTTVRILASDLWFTDALHIGEDDKKVIEQTAGAWICEIAELSGMSRKELEQVKHSMSKQEDRARGAYKGAAETVRRQFVMFGTTNEDRYLLDKENRRYWPLKIENEMALKRLKADRDQLWAEAAYREGQGELITLPEELWEVAAQMQKDRVVDQPIAEELKDRFEHKDNSFVTKRSIAKLLGYVDRHDHGQPSRVKMYEKKLIRQTMMEMGWVETGQAITYSYGVKRPDGGMSVNEDRQRGWIKGDRKDLAFVWIDGVASLTEDIEEGWFRVVKKD